MEWQLLQVLNLCTVLLLGILLAKVLGLFVYAFWARRGLIAFCFAESLYLSFQDNDTQFIWGHTPLAVQIYIYVFILGFICSWRLTPVGITGGIACGKSTVSSVLRASGCHLIDADEVARLVQQPGQAAYLKIVAAFGASVLDSDGTINRAALGSTVFGGTDKHKRALQQLNSIMHPAIARECLRQLVYNGLLRGRCVVYDAALMAESGTWMVCWPQVLNIQVKPETQVARLMKRNGLTETEAKARVAVQASPEHRARIANKTIDNSYGSVEELQHRAMRAVGGWL